MTQQSIQVSDKADVRYVLRIADSCLILSQRLSEWCGHGPILEEDLALTNMALDLVGQARALLTHAGQLDAQGHDEDQLAFLRDERQYFNLVVAELPRGDFAFTVARNLLLSSWLLALWQGLQNSRDAELAAIAAKAAKEAHYHQQHAADWFVRLGDGTEESKRRMQAALVQLWPYVGELFISDSVDQAAVAQGLGPSFASTRAVVEQTLAALIEEAELQQPAASRWVPQGHQGVHSEHMGHLLSTMQYLQRAYPGGVW
ncbi:1,2-phenylacetyl-CoA epoxidase subunit PaaC [Roseateles sp. BYS180W]|uniref:1,2-phenylacetyl-CoA epoxidase subunit PaaC n=1 Tax=Roseateles rivi TaxID=3299028 RepID=A0ABW7FY94_9BURK